MAHLGLDLPGDLGILAQEEAGVLLALTETLAAVGEPRAALVDDPVLDAQIDQVALAGDADVVAAEHDVELGLAEGGRHLVLDHLDARAPADDLVAVLDGADAADVEADGSVEAQGPAAGGRLGVAEHDADLHAQLVDEDDGGARLLDRSGELAQGLRHQPRLQAHLRVAHLSLQLGARHEGGHRVDDDHVDGAGAHQRVGDLQRFLAAVGLGDQEILDVDAEAAREPDVEGVLGVDEGRRAPALLGLGHRGEGAHRLARRLGAEHLDDPAAGQPPDAEGGVEGETSGGDDVDLDHLGLAQAHDGALAVLLFHLGEGLIHGLLPVLGVVAGPAAAGVPGNHRVTPLVRWGREPHGPAWTGRGRRAWHADTSSMHKRIGIICAHCQEISRALCPLRQPIAAPRVIQRTCQRSAASRTLAQPQENQWVGVQAESRRAAGACVPRETPA